jgi:type IV secretion system protein VirB6
MALICPAIELGDPLVRRLLDVTDCNVQGLVRSSYGALFTTAGAYASLLGLLLTLYVALIGYRLMLGLTEMSLNSIVLSVVKVGVVLAFSTQWPAYQTVVYRTMFLGPEQLADVIVMAPGGGAYGGRTMNGLQKTFDILTSLSPELTGRTDRFDPAPIAVPVGAPSPTPAASNPPDAGKTNFDAAILTASAVGLLLATVGVLLVAKVGLGVMIAVGPIFMALLLFDHTRSLFAGWLRASLIFSLAPFTTTVVLGFSLNLLAPWIEQVAAMHEQGGHEPGVAFGILILVLVTIFISLGLLVAISLVAASFQLPGRRAASGATYDTAVAAPAAPLHWQGRVERIVAALAAQTQRDAYRAGAGPGGGVSDYSDRRTIAPSVRGAAQGGVEGVDLESRIGQAPRRAVRPRAATAAKEKRHP